MILSQDELQALCQEWQRILRLQDWDVKVKVARGYDMGNKEGECEYTQSLRRAIIRILDPGDYSSNDWPYDMEETLVHELLHLHFAPFFTGETEDHLEHISQEVAIEQIAKALVSLKRRVGGVA